MRCALVNGFQTCALPISVQKGTQNSLFVEPLLSGSVAVRSEGDIEEICRKLAACRLKGAMTGCSGSIRPPDALQAEHPEQDQQSVVGGKRVTACVYLGGRWNNNKQHQKDKH